VRLCCAAPAAIQQDAYRSYARWRWRGLLAHDPGRQSRKIGQYKRRAAA